MFYKLTVNLITTDKMCWICTKNNLLCIIFSGTLPFCCSHAMWSDPLAKQLTAFLFPFLFSFFNIDSCLLSDNCEQKQTLHSNKKIQTAVNDPPKNSTWTVHIMLSQVDRTTTTTTTIVNKKQTLKSSNIQTAVNGSKNKQTTPPQTPPPKNNNNNTHAHKQKTKTKSTKTEHFTPLYATWHRQNKKKTEAAAKVHFNTSIMGPVVNE